MNLECNLFNSLLQLDSQAKLTLLSCFVWKTNHSNIMHLSYRHTSPKCQWKGIAIQGCLFHTSYWDSEDYVAIPTTGLRCDVPGCGDVFILDGNMKNSREVCLATHAGYAKFSGLPGRVRTGCPNTPGHKSRYCSLHAPCTVLPQDIQFSEDGSPITVDPTISSEERHVAIILSKRVTRNSKFYQFATQARRKQISNGPAVVQRKARE